MIPATTSELRTLRGQTNPLKVARVRLGITTAELAATFGVSVQAIMNWERQGDDRLVQFYQDWGITTAERKDRNVHHD